MPIWLEYHLIGLLGIVLHILIKVFEGKGRSFADLTAYLKENQLALLISGLGYTALVWLWGDGMVFDLLGIEPLPLNGGTFFVGYFSSSLLKTILGAAEGVLDNLASRFRGRKDTPGE